ncbi:hypothetical protein BIW12_02650 [Flavobacterium commune]|uniref:Uncharacterized protein n=1 Tax=Flavobacterium commune TaxID=1306519 RepID=A0A1D9P740_9FLAO|nr:hypothetical protein BIW12_02650 [Flavobacterium commune]
MGEIKFLKKTRIQFFNIQKTKKMKKFIITLSTVKSLQGWSETNNIEQFNLIECEFYSSNLESAEKFMKVLE